MKKQDENAKSSQEVVETKFTKEQWLASKRFESVHKDVLSVILADGSNYTLEQVERLIKETLERKAI